MTESQPNTQPESASAEPEMSARVDNRSHRPDSPAFREFISKNWAERPPADDDRLTVAPYAAARRAKLSEKFPGERLVIPAGALKVRSNDTDYRFRPHSAFAHLTGFSMEEEPDTTLVLEPTDDGHEAILYFRPRAGRDTEEFFGDSRYGEFWVGARASLEEIEALYGITARHLDEADEAITKDLGGIRVRVLRDSEGRVDALVDASREAHDVDAEEARGQDDELTQELSELRLLKDEHEIEQMREAIRITAEGFGEIIKALPRAVGHRRGERVVESAFESRAREEGNGPGYDTIAASGEHACTLHWKDNYGTVDAGDLILVDAGAETDSLYTADITRTLPVDGKYSEIQRKVYEAVLEAADAAFARAAEHTEGTVRFRDVHAAAMEVIAAKTAEWGLLPVSAEESLSDEGQFHRRWMVHGTSHHLGLDVHDCAQARKAMYLDAVLEPGMVFTIEPGLYFKPDDLAIPEELRGIGVRIEDDILITATGAENLSAGIPRTVDAVESWIAGQAS